jgi:hypothetical protein
MTRQVLYCASPLRPTEAEVREIGRPSAGATDRTLYEVALRANLDRAMRWLSWLRRSFPETTFIAPWIASVLAGGDDTDPAQREAGFVDDCAVIERCDGIVLCGGRISEGMRREMEHGRTFNEGRLNRFEDYDLTGISPGGESPPIAISGIAFAEWARRIDRIMNRIKGKP